jgi:predicted MFS family arabinose efflux permease
VRRVDQALSRLGARAALPGDGPGEVVAARGNDVVRAPLFVFILAEESSRAFLPLYIDSLAAPFLGLSEAAVIGLPITIFMLAIALATAPAGRLADRIGVRRTFALGLVPSVLGFVGTALRDRPRPADRGAGAVRGRLRDRLHRGAGAHGEGGAPGPARARDGGLHGRVFAAGVCGPAIGGIVVEETGPRAAFLIAAGFVLASALVLFWLVDPDPPAERPPSGGASGAREALRVLTAPRLLLLTVLCAVPAKVALTGFLFYMVPLELARLGNDPATIGRVIMVYGLCTVFLTPLAAGSPTGRAGRRSSWRRAASPPGSASPRSRRCPAPAGCCWPWRRSGSATRPR